MVPAHARNPFASLEFYLGSGGFIMPVLVLITIVLWYGIGYRWLLLDRGTQKSVRVMIGALQRGKSLPSHGIVPQAIAMRPDTAGWDWTMTVIDLGQASSGTTVTNWVAASVPLEELTVSTTPYGAPPVAVDAANAWSTTAPVAVVPSPKFHE